MEILLVEDSPSDAFIAKEALKRAGGTSNLHIAHDGVEALAFLRKQGDYFDAPRPDIILLDLNMPRKDGREVLAEIKSDNKFKCIPVIVLTSSSAEQDISTAYELHANCYITKPTDFSKFKDMLKSIESFWFNNVTLPPNAC
jgi:two-component system, chemotaxis family, response regulator Rcp1